MKRYCATLEWRDHNGWQSMYRETDSLEGAKAWLNRNYFSGAVYWHVRDQHDNNRTVYGKDSYKGEVA